MNTTIIFNLVAILFTSTVGASQNADMALSHAKAAESTLTNLGELLRDDPEEYDVKLKALEDARKDSANVLGTNKGDVLNNLAPDAVSTAKTAYEKTDGERSTAVEGFAAKQKVVNEALEADTTIKELNAKTNTEAEDQIKDMSSQFVASDDVKVTGQIVDNIDAQNTNALKKDAIWADAQTIGSKNEAHLKTLKDIILKLVELAKKKQEVIEAAKEIHDKYSTATGEYKTFVENKAHDDACKAITDMLDKLDKSKNGLDTRANDSSGATALAGNAPAVIQAIEKAISKGFVSDDDMVIEVLDTSESSKKTDL